MRTRLPINAPRATVNAPIETFDRFAAKIVPSIVERLPTLRGLDSGSLANAAPVEAFTAVLLHLNRAYKTRASIRITGLDEPDEQSAEGSD